MFVDLVFPGAIHAHVRYLWLISGTSSEAARHTHFHRSSEATSLGVAPDTRGPMSSPCSELP